VLRNIHLICQVGVLRNTILILRWACTGELYNPTLIEDRLLRHKPLEIDGRLLRLGRIDSTEASEASAAPTAANAWYYIYYSMSYSSDKRITGARITYWARAHERNSSSSRGDPAGWMTVQSP
jgi:hypothetical protein